VQYAKKPVIVVNYPKDIKAFYMRLNDDGRMVSGDGRARPGEIIGGTQREVSRCSMRMPKRGIDREHFAPP
jgi:asparaginyl-tRNA synthetase